MYMVSLNDTLAAHESSGGKGRQLALLLAHGFPVPLGFVIQTSAFDTFVNGSWIREDLATLIRGGKMLDPGSLTHYATEFTLRMNALPFPEGLSREISAVLEVDTNSMFAVRSSGSIEDGAHVACAGQFATLLSVPRQDIPAAVRKVWESVCSPHALASLIRARTAEIAMAVVVQVIILPR
ncbi:MAG: PEP/pyruvate-binding domain-containing protein, partial [Patescibacteria group bacterium]